MKAIIRILLLLLPFQAMAQNPQITSLSPSKIQTQSDPIPLFLNINGKNMWPDRLTILMAHDVMHVHFNRDGRDEIMPRSTIGADGYTLYFSSIGWADKPGTIEVYVTIDAYPGYAAYRSNSMYLTIEQTPTVVPVLTKLSISTFKMGSPKETYQLRVVGKNLGENASTSVTVGGLNAGISWKNLPDGVIDIYVPSEVYSRAGEYPVAVRTKYGTSNELSLKIEPQTMLIKPVIISPKPTVTQTTTVKAAPGNSVKIAQLSLNKENASRLNSEMLRGVRITMTGVIRDLSLNAQLESYTSSLENVFVVDNRLTLSDNPGNINIKMNAVGVEAAAVEQIKKLIQKKATELNLSVSITN